MVVHFRSVSSSSRPERKDVTEEIERRFRLQDEAAKAAQEANLRSQQPTETTASAQQ